MPAFLGLLKTGLRVTHGELVRTTKGGGVVMSLPLDSIRAVEFRSRFDPNVLGLIAAGVGFGALGYFVREIVLLASPLFLLAILSAVIVPFGLVSHRIIIRTGQAVIDISCADSADEGIGFVATLQSMIGGEGLVP
jgi:hypothetical protein